MFTLYYYYSYYYYIIIIVIIFIFIIIIIYIYPCIPTIFISLSHFMVIIIHISPIESPNVPGYLHGLGIVHRDLGGWNHTCPALRDRFSVGYPNSTCSLSWELYGKKHEARQYWNLRKSWFSYWTIRGFCTAMLKNTQSGFSRQWKWLCQLAGDEAPLHGIFWLGKHFLKAAITKQHYISWQKQVFVSCFKPEKTTSMLVWWDISHWTSHPWT